MADLIEKFFRSELTEAEDKALEKLLASSEDAAGQFAERAEKEYFSFGLPEPQAPGKLVRLLRSLGGKWIPGMIILGGVAAWVWWPKPENRTVPAVTLMPMAAPAPVRPAVQELPAARVKKARPTGPPPVPTVEAPPNPGFETDYRNLKLVVDQEAAGPITVRILGPNGFEVRRLYEGPLAAGKWSFSWDGVMADGMAAEKGIYHIEVLGAAKTASKEVIVR